MSRTVTRPVSSVLVLVLVPLAVAALACGSSGTPEVSPADSETESEAEEVPPAEVSEGEEDPSPTEAPEPTETPQPVGSARSNPAPPGFEVTLGSVTVSVGEVIRPATEIVMDANPFNTEPEEGQEYIFVEVITTCEEGQDDTCEIIGFEFSLIGSSGVVYEPEIFVAGVEGLYEGGEFFGGATRSGYMPFLIEQTETDLILKYEELFGGDAYLALGQ